jgi:hypothetical protein
MLYRPVNISTKNKNGYPATHKALLGQVLASITNQEVITYDNNDDDVHNIGMIWTRGYVLTPIFVQWFAFLITLILPRTGHG